MKEVHYFYAPQAATNGELPEEETIHALRVLRLKTGDELFLMDGQGRFYRAIVTETNNKHCHYHIEETIEQPKGWNGRIHLAIAPTKMMDRIEWMTEKITEIGFDELSLLNCKFSERKVIRKDRVEKIVLSAVKQSRKPFTPIVNELCPFKDFITQHTEGRRFIAHCYNEVEKVDFMNQLKDIPVDEEVTVLVGPEGDFSIDEVKYAVSQGYTSISLGDFRLRTETAGLVAVTMAQLSKRKS